VVFVGAKKCQGAKMYICSGRGDSENSARTDPSPFQILYIRLARARTSESSASAKAAAGESAVGASRRSRGRAWVVVVVVVGVGARARSDREIQVKSLKSAIKIKLVYNCPSWASLART
jgi:hypothetical protein